MKSLLTISLSFFISSSFGQSSDTSVTLTNRRKVLFSFQHSTNVGNQFRSFETPTQKNYLSKANILLATYNLQMSPTENEISDLESRECKAIEKRDTVMLRWLWSRDFTLDEPQNEISVNGKAHFHTTPPIPGLSKTAVWWVIKFIHQAMSWCNTLK